MDVHQLTKYIFTYAIICHIRLYIIVCLFVWEWEKWVDIIMSIGTNPNYIM